MATLVNRNNKLRNSDAENGTGSADTVSLQENNEIDENCSLIGDSNDTEVDTDKFETVESHVLNKVDKLLSSFDSKLSSMEKYLFQSVETNDSNSINDSNTESTFTKLVETLSSVKGYLYKNQQQNLHPLTKIIDDYYAQEEENLQEAEEAEEAEEGEAEEEQYKTQNTDIIKEHKHETRKRLIHTIQLLNARLTDFEHHHNLPSLANHPSERLIALKGTLYNYDTALTVSNHRHLTFYELPFQWRENKYIVYGYRFAKSHMMAILSLFSWHNETVNIWTHLLGSFYLFYLGFHDFPNSEHYINYTNSKNDHTIVYLFIASAIICLLFSVIWHCYTNIGYLSVRSKFACFDYSGITVLITSSIITTEHISLKDYPNLRFAFISFSVFAGLIGIGMAWHPYFDKPESRIIRIMFFISLSFLGVLSFLCSCLVHNLSFAWNLFSPLYISFVWYLSGVVFYGSFFPECIRSDVIIDDFEISDETIMELDRKGELLEYLRKQPTHTHNHGFTSLWWVDWIGNSHNFWHLFVIGGILGHYSALLEMFKRATLNA